MKDYHQRLGDKLIAKAGLGEVGVGELGKYMNHKERYVRSSVAIAMGKLGDSSAVDYLESLMDDESSHVIGAAAEAMDKINPAKLFEIVSGAYSSYDRQAKMIIVNVLGSSKSPGAAEVLKQIHQDEEDAELVKIIGKHLGEMEKDKKEEDE